MNQSHLLKSILRTALCLIKAVRRKESDRPTTGMLTGQGPLWVHWVLEPYSMAWGVAACFSRWSLLTEFCEVLWDWCYWKPGWLPKLEMLSRSQLRRKPNGNQWRATKTPGQLCLNSRLHTHSDSLPKLLGSLSLVLTWPRPTARSCFARRVSSVIRGGGLIPWKGNFSVL